MSENITPMPTEIIADLSLDRIKDSIYSDIVRLVQSEINRIYSIATKPIYHRLWAKNGVLIWSTEKQLDNAICITYPLDYENSENIALALQQYCRPGIEHLSDKLIRKAHKLWMKMLRKGYLYSNSSIYEQSYDYVFKLAEYEWFKQSGIDRLLHRQLWAVENKIVSSNTLPRAIRKQCFEYDCLVYPLKRAGY